MDIAILDFIMRCRQQARLQKISRLRAPVAKASRSHGSRFPNALRSAVTEEERPFPGSVAPEGPCSTRS